MFYPECKIYTDGNGYVCILHTEGRKGPRKKKNEPLIEVVDDPETNEPLIEVVDDPETKEPGSERKEPLEVKDIPVENNEPKFNAADYGLVEVTDKDILDLFGLLDEDIAVPKPAPKVEEKKSKGRLITRRQLFNELYATNFMLPVRERKEAVLKGMLPYFKKIEYAIDYVNDGFAKKLRNMICRRTRMIRKINLHGHFNYFITFTYDSKKQTEESFKRLLKNTLWNLTKRKDWQYIGVWERAPQTGRLHFHGIFDIPDGTMPGEIIEVKDWDVKKNRQQITYQNTYFNEKFGRSDFKYLTSKRDIGDCMCYLIKYLEKTGERIVSSKGLKQYFISDINEDDILAPLNKDNLTKFVLFDDFALWDEGVYMGQVSENAIRQMRKTN